jgi:hypothetical protein
VYGDALWTYDSGTSDGASRGGDAADAKLDVPYTADSAVEVRLAGNDANADGRGGATGTGGTTGMDAGDAGNSDAPAATGGVGGNDGSTATGGAGVTDGPLGTGGVAGSDGPSVTGGTSVADGGIASDGVDGSDGPSEAGGPGITDGPLATGGVAGSDGPSEAGGTTTSDGPLATDGVDASDGPSIADGGCLPVSCITANGDQYCGDIGNACGSTQQCATTCAKAGWVCQNGLCQGPPWICTPLACQPASGGKYCGTIGDGCGHPLDCGTDCSAAGTGWVCSSNNVCLGGSDCLKVTCNDPNGVQQYCGDIGDGCGGTLSCPTTCPAGTTCDAAHICRCGNLCLNQVGCYAGAPTSISGTVYDPAGMNPLYNVIVSVPNAPLDPIPAGVTCASCDTQVSGQPIATALTDTKGHFVLNNVPWGTDFPLVMQLGKWRRQVTISAAMVTNQCADNPILETSPASLLRLPRNIRDGDNNGQYTSIPKIAIAAGNAHPASDSTVVERLQCFLRRIGVDASEFTLPTGSGSVILYNQAQTPDTCNQMAGSAATYPDATSNLWDNPAHLNQYDVILLNCGGSQAGVDPTTTAGQAFIANPGAVDRMRDYVNSGGRVFAEHYHWAWIRAFTGYPSRFGDVATWSTQTGVIGSMSRDTLIDQSFPKGVAFASWLSNVGASMEPGHLTLSSNAKYTAIDQIKPPSQRWIYEPANSVDPTGAAQYTHYFSFNTPIGAAEADQCGRFSYTAMHVSDSASLGFTGDPAKTGTGAVFTTFPDCCSVRTTLSPQEKALEFMFFDFSGCVSPPPLPPPPPPPSGALPPPPQPPQPPPPVSTHATARPGQ